MAFTRFATSEPWTRASGERINQLGDELEQQISILSESGISASYTVADFDAIPNDKRYLRSGGGTPNAPNAGQFVGMQNTWDANFKFLIGADIYGNFFARHSAYNWKQIATTDKIDISSYLVNTWGKVASVTPYAAISGNIATINARIGKSTAPVTWEYIFQGLPTTLKPLLTVTTPLYSSTGNIVGCCIILSNGGIQFNTTTNYTDVSINATYILA